MAALVGAVAHGEEDDVALVALDVLQILHKDRFLAVVGQPLKCRVLAEFIDEDIFDQVLLHLAE